MENYLTNFKVMLGDEQLAAEKLEEIRRMAASTPFTLSDLTDGTQTLLQFGIAADDTTGVLKQLGDISLGNADKLQTLVRAYGKMSSAQKVTLENVNMMIDAGFNPLNQICDATGESMSDLYKRISDGKVGFDELAAAVEAATSEGGQFYNGMLEASQTVNGRLSTLQDNISALIGKLTDGLFNAYGDIIGKANELVVAFLDDDEKMRQLKETIGVVTAVVTAAGAAFLGYKSAVTATTIVTTAQTAVTAALAAMHKAAESGAKGLAIAQAGLNAVLKANPTGLVVSLVAALAAGLVTAYQTSETFRNIVNGAFQAVANIAKSAIGAAIGWLDKLSYKLNSFLGKDGYTGFSSYDDYKADKDAQAAAAISKANREARHKAAQAGQGISNKSWTELQNEAKAAAAESQKAAQTISSSASKAKTATTKAASEVVNSITSTSTQVENGVTRTTETVNETLKNGTQQQKQTVTETSRQMVNGVLSDVKTITTTAADGSQKVTQSIEAVRDVVSSTKDTQTQLVDGVKVTVEKTTQLLADGSERISTVTTRTGKEIIDGVERTVKTVTTKTADGVESTVRTIEDAGPQYASAGELLTTQFRSKLNSSWEQINKSIQSDVIGSIQTLFKAIQDGDLESIATWSAAYFWNACTQEQRTQIQTFALDALSKLSSSLSGVFQNVARLASSFVGQFVPAVAAATTGQTALNVAMDANPIMLVVSLIGMLVGALVSFAGTNKSVGEGFKKVWYGVEDIASFVFESILRAIGLNVQGFVSAVNAIIDTYNWAASKLGLSTISRVSNPLWKAADKLADQRRKRQAERKLQDKDAATESGSKKVIESLTDTRKETRQDGTTVTTKTLTEKLQDDAGRITTQVTKTITEAGKRLVDGVERSYKTITTYVDGVKQKTETILDDLDKSSSSGASSGTPAPDNTGAIEDNTAAILAANEKLAEMVRRANSLVLSDNMAVSRSVAASGTAQIAAAANNYHRDGDTNIVQNIYSKAQTAADLARETRWEADRAKATKH
nr:MAG TPA: tail tape measure protein [Bacteriophage sp.]